MGWGGVGWGGGGSSPQPLALALGVITVAPKLKAGVPSTTSAPSSARGVRFLPLTCTDPRGVRVSSASAYHVKSTRLVHTISSTIGTTCELFSASSVCGGRAESESETV